MMVRTTILGANLIKCIRINDILIYMND